ncbi:FtsB family cell division protein [Psittacicella hinzii]|uniref:Cell division protein FtsB n=1 Tax=Psittacicella hinzii TaxID=2028575 RepID=A0A3A1YK43_9GAMM|nr:septum formation initiator family protein [Psittacicella hinzii]RIY37826.1 hypothetical protein CKF58_04665 [Psittacicella hinzii]
MGVRFFNLLLLMVIGYLIYGIIAGRNGYIYYTDMKEKVSAQAKINQQLSLDNAYLQQRVEALKAQDLVVYESFIRRELNYVRPDEIFFRIIDNRVMPTYYSKEAENKYNPQAPTTNKR